MVTSDQHVAGNLTAGQRERSASLTPPAEALAADALAGGLAGTKDEAARAAPATTSALEGLRSSGSLVLAQGVLFLTQVLGTLLLSRASRHRCVLLLRQVEHRFRTRLRAHRDLVQPRGSSPPRAGVPRTRRSRAGSGPGSSGRCRRGGRKSVGFSGNRAGHRLGVRRSCCCCTVLGRDLAGRRNRPRPPITRGGRRHRRQSDQPRAPHPAAAASRRWTKLPHLFCSALRSARGLPVRGVRAAPLVPGRLGLFELRSARFGGATMAIRPGHHVEEHRQRHRQSGVRHGGAWNLRSFVQPLVVSDHAGLRRALPFGDPSAGRRDAAVEADCLESLDAPHGNPGVRAGDPEHCARRPACPHRARATVVRARSGRSGCCRSAALRCCFNCRRSGFRRRRRVDRGPLYLRPAPQCRSSFLGVCTGSVSLMRYEATWSRR